MSPCTGAGKEGGSFLPWQTMILEVVNTGERSRGAGRSRASPPPAFFVPLRWVRIPRTVKCSIWYPVVLCSSAPSLPRCGSQVGLVSWIQRLCLETSWATTTKDTGGVQWELTLSSASSVVQILSCSSAIQLQPKHPGFPAPRHWCLLSADRVGESWKAKSIKPLQHLRRGPQR